METALGIVVPAYRPDIKRLSAYVKHLVTQLNPTALRIELDSPQENSEAALHELPVQVATSPYRRGKGAAITAGFETLAPDVDILLFVDADGSTSVDEAAHVVHPLYANRAELAVGSRRHPDAEVLSHQTFARRRLGDAFAWVARRLLDTKLYDYQCGAKAITTEAWNRVKPHLYEPGFAWDVELLGVAGALGIRVGEVPIQWKDAPNSTVDPLTTSFNLGRALLLVRHRSKQLNNSRLHGALAAARTETETALVDRDHN
jgi:hypothetical protein